MTALRLLRQHRERKRTIEARLTYANSVEDIQSEVLRCAEEGERLRPIGGHRMASVLGASDENLLSLERLRGAELAQIERRRMWVRPGTPLNDLIGWLARHDLGIEVTPDYPGQTVGAAVATGSPPRLADYIVGLRIVHADGHRTTYSIERDRGLFDAMRVSLGVMGVLTQVELRCVERRTGGLRHRQASFSEALSVLEAPDAVSAGQAVIWFANAPAIVEYYDADAVTPYTTQLYEQARGVMHDSLAIPLLGSLAATIKAGPRWSDQLGAAITGAPLGGSLPLHSLPTARRLVYAIPAGGAAAFLMRLRELWRSLRFPVYAPVRIEFAPADPAWLSPTHDRDSAVVSVPYVPITSKHFIDAISNLLESSDGRPSWAHLRRSATMPTATAFPRLTDFGALRTKIDRRGVFLNSYLSSLFDIKDR